MCGIGGIFSRRELCDEGLTSRSNRMLADLKHRGPDGSGIWRSRDGRMRLVHSRLAIIDLTETGRQPMSTEDGRFTIVLNGEIYNYRELRSELAREGELFRGTSDTEVLLRLLAREGTACLARLDGMFAFAIHDAVERTVLLGRDPLGEKPLYVAESEDGFAFASEVRTLQDSGFGTMEPDWQGIGLFLRQGSIPAPWTHLRGIRLLPAGSWTRLHLDGGREETGVHWQLALNPESRAIRDRAEAVARIGDALRGSVRRRLRADVPVAAFLSGGVDSSSVVALMREAGGSDLRTFTISLPGSLADESREAEAVAATLGTVHTTVPLGHDQLDEWLDAAIDAMDVPSVDGPNTWLVSRAVARAGLKVVVSGLGGDELFYGYPSFRVVPRLAGLLRSIGRAGASRAAARRLAKWLPSSPRAGRLLDAVGAGGGLPATWLAKRGLFSAGGVRNLLRDDVADTALQADAIGRIEGLDVPSDLPDRRRVSFLELSVYLRDQLLRDSDVMSMAHGLELRVPLIGRHVVEAVAAVSDEVLAEGGSKALLREAVGPALPGIVGSWPKQGFTLDWQRLLPRRDSWRSLESELFRPGAAKSVWELWHSGRVGFAYPFALEVLARALDGPRTA
ncbi:MAG TPA: asparagine synthase (glutamine-hydrolyzing) [Thermoanaerobaculia bacterium]|nr:asparagine synthase (glutamine-hydrolyzing) [Thermoanaerobaculia bacterium]